MKLLIVDDEILIAQGIQLIILRMKTAFEEVDVAFSGQEALEKLENTQYDLMITDINMPDMSGLELIRQVLNLRSVWVYPSIC